MRELRIVAGTVSDEGRAVLDVVQHARTCRLLVEFDEERLPWAPHWPVAPAAVLSLADARRAIADLEASIAGRGEGGPLFGRESEDGLAAALGSVEQTFDGKALYHSVQCRAAHLLYFIVKDHPFVDGNKRIGTLLFLDYLRRNRMLLRADGEPRLADNAMVALALLLAESDCLQKDLMIRLVLSLLEDVSE